MTSLRDSTPERNIMCLSISTLTKDLLCFKIIIPEVLFLEYSVTVHRHSVIR